MPNEYNIFINTVKEKRYTKQDIIDSVLSPPAIMLPKKDSVVNNPLGLIIELSNNKFNLSNTEHKHEYTDWEVATDDRFVNIVASSYNDTINKYTKTFLIDQSGRYYIRARYKTKKIIGSWSSVVGVDYNPPPGIKTPTIISENNRLITSSLYETSPSFTEPHISTDWEVAIDDQFQSIVFTSYNDSINKTNIKLNTLISNTDYWVRVKYNSNSKGSEWSEAFHFYAQIYIPIPRIIYPTATDEPFKSIIIEDYDGNKPLSFIRLYVEIRYKIGDSGTFTSWTTSSYPITSSGVYYAGGWKTTRYTDNLILECRVRYHYTDGDPDSPYSNVVRVVVPPATPYHIPESTSYDSSDNLRYRSSEKVSYITGSPFNRIEVEIYYDRYFLNRVFHNTTEPLIPNYTMTSVGYFSSDRNKYPFTPLCGFIPEPNKPIYVRFRFWTSDLSEHTPWSQVTGEETTGPGYAPGTTITLPSNNAIISQPTIVRLSSHTTLPYGRWTKAIYNKNLIEIRIGTSLDADNNVTNIEQEIVLIKRYADQYLYISPDLPNTNYYIQARWLGDLESTREWSLWTPPIQVNTDLAYSAATIIDPNNVKCRGEAKGLISAYPFFYLKNYFDGTTDPNINNPGLDIMVKDNTGNVVYTYSSLSIQYTYGNFRGYRGYVTDDSYSYMEREKLNIGETYTVYFRHSIGKWQTKTITIGSDTVIPEVYKTTPYPGPSSLAYTTMVDTVNKLYLFKITFSNPRTIDSWIYNKQTEVWSQGPTNTFNDSIANINRPLYNTYHNYIEFVPYNTTVTPPTGYRFDLNTNTWVVGNTYNPPFTTLKYNTHLYQPSFGNLIIGGQLTSITDPRNLKSITGYDDITNNIVNFSTHINSFGASPKSDVSGSGISMLILTYNGYIERRYKFIKFDISADTYTETSEISISEFFKEIIYAGPDNYLARTDNFIIDIDISGPVYDVISVNEQNMTGLYTYNYPRRSNDDKLYYFRRTSSTNPLLNGIISLYKYTRPV